MRRTTIQARLDGAAAIALIALAAALPFELTRPAVSAGPIWITTVELLLYLSLALSFGAAMAQARSLPSLPLPAGAAAIAVWAVVVIVSAAIAREPRTEALKFGLRSVGAAGLAFATARATALPWARPGILAGLAAGAWLSALSGALEGLSPDFAELLSPFRTQTFSLAGYPRAMGTFQYPTIAAMFWEATAPVTIALIAWIPIRSGIATAGLAGLAGAVFGGAIAATLSRAGIVVTALALLALAGIAWWRFRRRFAAAAFGTAGYLFAALAVFLASPALGARLQSESDTALNRADARVVTGPPETLPGGAPFTLTVAVMNRGIETWPARGPRAVVASYHWIDADRSTYLLFEGARTPLPMDIAPGETVTLAVRGAAPGGPGRLTLQFDLQRQDGAWFTQKGNSMPELSVEVAAAPAASAAAPDASPRAFIPPSEQGEVGRLQLWRVAVAMWMERPLLGAGPDNFRHLYGAYLNRRDFNAAIHANSLYFDTLANLGLAGLAAVLALGAAIGRRLLRVVGAPSARPDNWLLVAALVSLGAYFAHGAIDYFLEFTPTLGLFFVLAGCAAQLRRSAQPE